MGRWARLSAGACLLVTTFARSASAEEPDTLTPPPSASDGTGGPNALPSTLVTGAAAMPAKSVRIVGLTDVQTPSGEAAIVRPGVFADIGLGNRLTGGLGIRWLGGDPKSEFGGVSPFLQLRFQLFGRKDGQGFLGGVGLGYKVVGFQGAEHELEGSFSLQHRTRYTDVAAQFVLGQSLSVGSEHDMEGRLMAALRPIPQLALGGAAQLRGFMGTRSAAEADAALARNIDLVGGGLASWTPSDHFQLGALVGASTLALNIYTNAAFYSQAFVGFQY